MAMGDRTHWQWVRQEERLEEEIERLRAELAAERKKRERAEASCVELRKAVYEAMEWNWLDEEAEPPADVQESIKHALSTDAGRAYAERMERYRERLQQIHDMELPYAPSGMSDRAQWYQAATSWRLTAEQMQEIAGDALEVSDDGE